MAHRATYERFNGPIPDGLIVRHDCDNPACVNPEHLRVGTKLDNAQDCVSRGRNAKREGHGRARLTEDDVTEIRARSFRGETYLTLAREFGVAETTIGRVVRGETWPAK